MLDRQTPANYNRDKWAFRAGALAALGRLDEIIGAAGADSLSRFQHRTDEQRSFVQRGGTSTPRRDDAAGGSSRYACRPPNWPKCKTRGVCRNATNDEAAGGQPLFWPLFDEVVVMSQSRRRRLWKRVFQKVHR
jgi:hypothetical protein